MDKKGLALVSDGIDSPVALYLMARKGERMDAVHFSVGNEMTTQKVFLLINKAASPFGWSPRLYVIDFRPVQEEIRLKCYTRFQCILCKRMMHKIAEALAEKEGYSYLVNGENLGQVASQTLENMHTIHEGLTIKVVQPVLTRDKNETADIAKRIGTYDISISGAAKCPYLPPNPLTRSTVFKIQKEERNLYIPGLVENALNGVRVTG